MLALAVSTQFKRDLKACKKRHYDLSQLKDVVDILRQPAKLPAKYRDHPLSGNYVNHRECHVSPNWLLIYRTTNDTVFLDRTGTHSDLFG